MKTKNLFKIMAVLSPIVLASTLSVSAIAESNVSSPDKLVIDSKVLQQNMDKAAQSELTQPRETNSSEEDDSLYLKTRKNLFNANKAALKNLAQERSNELSSAMIPQSQIDQVNIAKPQINLEVPKMDATILEEGRSISDQNNPIPALVEEPAIERELAAEDNGIEPEIISAEELASLGETVLSQDSPDLPQAPQGTSEVNQSEVLDNANNTAQAPVLSQTSTIAPIERDQPVEQALNIDTNGEAAPASIDLVSSALELTDPAPESQEAEVVTAANPAPESQEAEVVTAANPAPESQELEEIAATDAAIQEQLNSENSRELADNSLAEDSPEQAALNLISDLPIDQVDSLTSQATQLASLSDAGETLPPEDVTDALDNIEATAQEASQLEASLETAPESEEKTELQKQLEQALVELKEAKEKLENLSKEKDELIAENKEKDSKLEEQATRYDELSEKQDRLNKAYCEREDQFAKLTEKLENLEENSIGKIQEKMMAMMMPVYMNMLASKGPSIYTGLDANFAQQFFGNTRANNPQGVQALSLVDLFNARSFGGINNIYVGGDYIGGNSTRTSSPRFAYNQNPLGELNERFGLQNSMRPFQFDFNSTITENDDFYRPFPRGQRSFADRNMIERNLDIMGRGGRVFDTPQAPLLPGQQFI